MTTEQELIAFAQGVCVAAERRELSVDELFAALGMAVTAMINQQVPKPERHHVAAHFADGLLRLFPDPEARGGRVH